jgi:adenylate cyclase
LSETPRPDNARASLAAPAPRGEAAPTRSAFLSRSLSFRLTLTVYVLVMIGLLAALLVYLQFRALNLAVEDAATSTMDAASRNTVSSLHVQIDMLARITWALALSPAIDEAQDPDENSPAARFITANLAQWPGLDSIYVGYENGHWLQVERLEGLTRSQRDRVGGPPDAFLALTVTRWVGTRELPTRRVFEDRNGQRIAEIDVPPRDYDARRRGWYIGARKAGKVIASAPYLSFNLRAPMITFSAPLGGAAAGVIGLDLKLDRYSQSAPQMKLGKSGYLVLFNSDNTLIAHPDYAAMFARASANPDHPGLPNTGDLVGTIEGKVIAEWDKTSPYRRELTWKGRNYFARLETTAPEAALSANVLLIAPKDEFARGIRRLNDEARILALAACLLFIPLAWIVGGRMSRTVRAITEEAERLQTMAPPRPAILSFISELDTLGRTIQKSQRAIWSFSRLAPREIVRGVLDNSISTELGGERREITVLFTDVRDFTAIAESADPDALMQQTSQYFTALTDVILAEKGTVDKFIGDAIMAFWNAPHAQPDHCERACAAALEAKRANEAINRSFEAQGLRPFFTRFGIHVGDAVVGNLGSSERMNYTALGNVVNLAARLEGLSKLYGTQILVSGSVYERVKHRFACRFVDTVIAKGMTAETRIYELVGDAGEGAAELASPARSEEKTAPG